MPQSVGFDRRHDFVSEQAIVLVASRERVDWAWVGGPHPELGSNKFRKTPRVATAVLLRFAWK